MTYINDDCYLAEASQEVVPDTCRTTEVKAAASTCQISKYQSPLDGISELLFSLSKLITYLFSSPLILVHAIMKAMQLFVYLYFCLGC